MKVLVACETSGVVRQAFRSKGHDAFSNDILPSDDNSPYHILGDCTSVLDGDWDLLIAHRPCTRLCNSGGALARGTRTLGRSIRGGNFIQNTA